jgi:hypothetical protein
MSAKKKTFLFDAMKLDADLFRMPDDGRKWRYDAGRRKHLFVTLGGFADRDGTGACPGTKKVCARTGFTRSALYRYLGDLLLAGWITNCGKSRFQGTTKWDLHLVPVPVEPEKKSEKKPESTDPHKPSTVPDSSSPTVPDSNAIVPDSSSNSPTLEATVPDSEAKPANVGHDLSLDLPTGTVKDICPPTNQSGGWTAGWSEDSDNYETFKDCGQVNPWTVVQVLYNQTRRWFQSPYAGKDRKIWPSAMSRHGLPELEVEIKRNNVTKEETADVFGMWLHKKFAPAAGTDHEITSPVLLFARDLHGLVIEAREEERRWQEKQAEKRAVTQ